MSESEQVGQCRREITAAYESTRYKPSDSDMLIADAIDRLAADVATVRAKVDAVAPEDVRHFVESEKAWVALIEERCGVAIRECKEARAEVERLKAARERLIHLCGKQQDEVDRLRKELDDREQTEQVKRLREANETLHRKSINYIHNRDQYRRERDQARAEVERLKAELAARQPDGNRPEKLDSSPAAPQPAGQGISPGLPGTQPPRNAAPAPGWLTDRERHVLSSMLLGRPVDWTLHWRDDVEPVIRSLLARAGSPPVVEVPAISERDVPKRNEAFAYRAALDKAGVAWKEV